MSSALERLKELTSKISSYELTRKENMKSLRQLYDTLGLEKKVGEFSKIFEYKAINLSALSLQKESFMQIQEGKYLQLLAIVRVDGKSKNISLAYFGRVESVDMSLRMQIAEFVIRYRFEKSFMNLEYYYELLGQFGNDA